MSFNNAMALLQKPFLELPYGRDSRYRTLNAIIDSSRANTTITAEDFGADGKLRKVKVNYYPIDCDGAADDCGGGMCGDAEVVQPKQREFTLKRCTASKRFGLSKDDVRKVGDAWTFSKHAQTQIMSKIDSVRKKLNDELVLFLRTNVGCQPDGQPAKKISLTDPNTGAIRPKGMFEIERTLQDAGMIDPIIVGGGDVFTWEKGLTIGGLNAQGQRIDQVAPGNVYYDNSVEAAFGDNTQGHIIAYSAQALKFISWNKNVGQFATDLDTIADLDTMYHQGDTFIHGTIMDPVTGLVWDLNIIYEACDEQWKFQYKLNWDIFMMPEWVCNLDCVNGIFHFTTCLPAPVDCPAVTPPTPVTPDTFSWTPGLTFPYYLGDLSLAGQDTTPNVTVTSLTELAAVLNDSIAGYRFVVNGTAIEYNGYKAITGKANGGTLTITFTNS